MSISWHPFTTYTNRQPQTEPVSGSATEKFTLPDHVIRQIENDLKTNGCTDINDDEPVHFRLPEEKN